MKNRTIKGRKSEQGYSLIEVLIVMAVLVVVTQAFTVFLSFVATNTTQFRRQTFATNKAVEMLEELRSLINDDVASVQVLDAYSDSIDASANYNPMTRYTLTTKRDVTHPGGNTANDAAAASNPVSGNPIIGSQGYVFCRHIEVKKDAKDANIRKVYVRIWEAVPNKGTASTVTPTAASNKPIAEVYGVLKSLGSGNVPTQVIDMYFVAVESVPGWWTLLANLQPLMDTARIGMQARNPGLKIRQHWVRRMSYGRDPEYTPEINKAVRADTQASLAKTYIYPGSILFDNGAVNYFYTPDWFKGRMNVDGAIVPNDNYPIADQYNHAVRYPDEQGLYAMHQRISANKGEVAEPSLRMLQEKLNSGDPSVINSIVINLHGELVPVVPLRNYDDAAKDPAYFTAQAATSQRGFRLVTHPTKLSYKTVGAGIDPVLFKVYAYDTNPIGDNPVNVTTEASAIINVGTLFVPGASLSQLVSIDRLEGNSVRSYKWISWTASNWTSGGGKYYDSITSAALSTWVAENFTPAGRNPGLRITLQGVTPTVRAYIPPVYKIPNLGGGNLCADVFDNTTLTPPDAWGVSSDKIDYDWGTTGPGGVNPNGFSVRFTADVQADPPANYTAMIYADSGIRLWVDNVLVINRWTNSYNAVSTSATVCRCGKAMNHIVVEYYHSGTGTAEVHYYDNMQGPMNTELNFSGGGANCGTPPPPPGPLGGLDASARLYGLEYIPFPTQKDAAYSITDAAAAFTSVTPPAWAWPKNTARWRIVLAASVSQTVAAGSPLAVETRIGPNGASCLSGWQDMRLYDGTTASNTSFVMPGNPQNLSSTYVWFDNVTVPATEQIDAVGDPRYVPYLDMMGSTGYAFAGGYNWFFKRLNTAGDKDYKAAYFEFVPQAKFDRYDGFANFDIPKLFALWRVGMLNSRSLYEAISGFSAYYVGLGGEFGGDNNGMGTHHVFLSGAPYNINTPQDKVDEILDSSVDATITHGTQHSIREKSATPTWRALPFIGELWPDSAYAADWASSGGISSWGNLRNGQSGGSWMRDKWSNCSDPKWFVWPDNKHLASFWGTGANTHGSSSFFNGGGTAGSYFNHVGAQQSAVKMPVTNVMALDFGSPIDTPVAANRVWGLSIGSAGPEAAETKYSSMRTSLDIYSSVSTNASAGSTFGFYDSNGYAAMPNTTARASGVVRAYDATANKAAWFIMSGLNPSGQSGVDFTARFSLLTAIRTFHEAGVPTATASYASFSLLNQKGASSTTFRMEPIPYVQITAPVVGQLTKHLSVIPVAWTQRYARWDANKYTESYPCLDDAKGTNPKSDPSPCGALDPNNPGNPNLEWHSEEPLFYNVKYSTDKGYTWKSAFTNTTAYYGVPMTPTADAVYPVPGQHTFNYSWNVVPLTAGTKLLMIECYRKNIGQHFAYHQIDVDVLYP